MSGTLNDTDRRYLEMAVKLSRGYLEDSRRWPFGAVVVADAEVAGRGVNQVVELRDPTAHAEVLALRAAGQALGTHQFAEGNDLREQAVAALRDWAGRQSPNAPHAVGPESRNSAIR